MFSEVLPEARRATSGRCSGAAAYGNAARHSRRDILQNARRARLKHGVPPSLLHVIRRSSLAYSSRYSESPRICRRAIRLPHHAVYIAPRDYARDRDDDDAVQVPNVYAHCSLLQVAGARRQDDVTDVQQEDQPPPCGAYFMKRVFSARGRKAVHTGSIPKRE